VIVSISSIIFYVGVSLMYRQRCLTSFHEPNGWFMLFPSKESGDVYCLFREYRIPRAKLDECEFSFVESADTVSGV
jgi:hypothetical protein